MLKKTKSELLMQMGSRELTQWMAFHALQDEEYKKKVEREVSLEDGANKSQEDLAEDMRRMLMGIQNG